MAKIHGLIAVRVAQWARSAAVTGGVEPSLWQRLWHFYQFKRDEFLPRYHQRSNVESTFSMIKAKFGDALRSKTDVALVNEALAKVLCHNVCVVIQSMYELGIEATFWPTEAVATPGA